MADNNGSGSSSPNKVTSDNQQITQLTDQHTALHNTRSGLVNRMAELYFSQVTTFRQLMVQTLQNSPNLVNTRARYPDFSRQMGLVDRQITHTTQQIREVENQIAEVERRSTK
jgi:CII-binding regulator of phage lambda lysogenization HflD